MTELNLQEPARWLTFRVGRFEIVWAAQVLFIIFCLAACDLQSAGISIVALIVLFLMLLAAIFVDEKSVQQVQKGLMLTSFLGMTAASLTLNFEILDNPSQEFRFMVVFMFAAILNYSLFSTLRDKEIEKQVALPPQNNKAVWNALFYKHKWTVQRANMKKTSRRKTTFEKILMRIVWIGIFIFLTGPFWLLWDRWQVNWTVLLSCLSAVSWVFLVTLICYGLFAMAFPHYLSPKNLFRRRRRSCVTQKKGD